LFVPGSPLAALWSAAWSTCRRRFEITRGWRSLEMSMMRAAPTASGLPFGLSVACVYSSNSST